MTVTFADEVDGCRIVLTHDLAPAWEAYADRASAGWTMILDSLTTAIND